MIWDSYTDTTQTLPAIVYDNLVPHLTTYPRPVLPTVKFHADTVVYIPATARVHVDGALTNFNATFSIKEQNTGVVLKRSLDFDTRGDAVLDTNFVLDMDKTFYMDLFPPTTMA